MKKTILFFICFMVIKTFAFSSIQPSDEWTISKLSGLCKVWGVLKYYDPHISKGSYNWDNILIKEIPVIMPIQNKQEYNQEIRKWVAKYSHIKSIDFSNHQNTSPVLKELFPDTTLLNASSLSLLNHLINLNDFGNFYWANNNGSHTPYFTEEKEYLNFADSLTTNYKLLSLFRFWNVINYFYPYKNLISRSWDQVLNEYIGLIINSPTMKGYQQLLDDLSYTLEDTHACIDFTNVFLNSHKKYNYPSYDFYYTPFYTRYVDSALIVYRFYSDTLDKNGIMIGDEIEAIDGKKVNELFSEKLKKQSFSYSNKAYYYANLSGSLLTTEKKKVKLDIKRGDAIFSDSIKNYPINELMQYLRNTSDTLSYKFLDSNLIYVNPAAKRIRDFWAFLSENKDQNLKFIFDFRRGSQFFIDSVAKYFFDSKSCIAFSSYVTAPGVFAIDSCNYGYANTNSNNGAVVLLVNENTFSLAEYTAMAFQYRKNTYTVGSQTAGTDGNVTQLSLPGGYIVKFTGIGICYPDGGVTQKNGIHVDFIVKPTKEDIRFGKDPLLDKALSIIRSVSK